MDATAATIVDLFGSVHDQLRELVNDLENEDLNWSPGPEMNTVAVLVTHTLGSELDTLLLVRDIKSDRVREAEFQVNAGSAAELLEAIDRADALLAEHGNRITAEELAATRTRPDRDPQIGLHWLINNYGHAREHIGHLGITRQLYRQRS